MPTDERPLSERLRAFHDLLLAENVWHWTDSGWETMRDAAAHLARQEAAEKAQPEVEDLRARAATVENVVKPKPDGTSDSWADDLEGYAAALVALAEARATVARVETLEHVLGKARCLHAAVRNQLQRPGANSPRAI